MQADAFVVAGDIAYLVEFKTVLGEAAVDDVEMKLVKIRWGKQAAGRPAGRSVQAVARSRGACSHARHEARSPPLHYAGERCSAGGRPTCQLRYRA